MTYRHKEAFALMWYACKCGHRERLWNSRDGVTPFGFGCPSCSGTVGDKGLLHVWWNLDVCVPNHTPHPGQRIWRDGTREDAEAILRDRQTAFAAAGHQIPDEHIAAMLASYGTETSEFQPGWPMLEVTP